MKLLVFEYSSVCLDNSLISEGFHMLNSLLSDLNEFSFFDTYFLINSELNSFNFNNCTSINIDSDILEWLNENCNYFDYCLFIAPEDNLIQYNISKILEEHDVKIIGSDSNASFICSSKYLTYKHVPQDVLKIKSWKFNLCNFDLEVLPEIIGCSDFIVKPDDRTSSDLIYHVHNFNELQEVLEVYDSTNVNDFLVQEYVPGSSVSVSLLCNDKNVNCISVNSQLIKCVGNTFEYMGCISPIDHELKDELFSLSERIVKSIPGLNGFVGIDFIINDDEIYFVEVNSRITTPFIVLQKYCDMNLTNSIINAVLNNKLDNITFRASGLFEKEIE